jgi:hypothetical protein
MLREEDPAAFFVLLKVRFLKMFALEFCHSSICQSEYIGCNTRQTIGSDQLVAYHFLPESDCIELLLNDSM